MKTNSHEVDMAKRKKNKNHLPKRIMGVKIPKEVRRGAIGAMLASPVAANVIGNMIYDAGRAATEDTLRRPTVRWALRRPVAALRGAGTAALNVGHDAALGVRNSAERFASAVSDAARQFSRSMNGGKTSEEPRLERGRRGRRAAEDAETMATH
jgi:hypothetical protein